MKMISLVQLLLRQPETASADRFHLGYNISSFSRHSRRAEMSSELRRRGKRRTYSPLIASQLGGISADEDSFLRLKCDCSQQTLPFLHILTSEQCDQLFSLSFIHRFITLFVEQSSHFGGQDSRTQTSPGRGVSGWMLVPNQPALEYMRQLSGDRCRKHFSVKNVSVKHRSTPTRLSSSDTFPIASVRLILSVGLLWRCCKQPSGAPASSCLTVCLFSRASQCPLSCPSCSDWRAARARRPSSAASEDVIRFPENKKTGREKKLIQIANNGYC